MNWIDIVALLLLVLAIFNGARQGLVVQICSMLAIIVGIWLGMRSGVMVGDMFGVDPKYAYVVGFLIIFLVVIIGVAICSRLLKTIFRAVGLGSLDGLLGVLLSVCKCLLIMCLLFSAFDALNDGLNLVSQKTLNSSMSYKLSKTVGDAIFPAFDWTKNQIGSGLEKL